MRGRAAYRASLADELRVYDARVLKRPSKANGVVSLAAQKAALPGEVRNVLIEWRARSWVIRADTPSRVK
jgi:hypothetical protein